MSGDVKMKHKNSVNNTEVIKRRKHMGVVTVRHQKGSGKYSTVHTRENKRTPICVS